MTDTFENDNILSLLSQSKHDKNLQNFIINTLNFASDLCNSDACFLYKLTPSKYINLEYMNIKSLHLEANASSCDKFFSPIFTPEAKNKKIKNTIEICAIDKDIVNSPNIYNEPDIDASDLKEFDLDQDYNSVSLLAFPLFDSNNNILAVIQFVNTQNTSGKISNFSSTCQNKLISLCQLISFALENQQKNELSDKFLEGFVLILSKILMSKSPKIASTGRQIPIITQMIAMALSSSDNTSFKNFEMSDNEWSCLNLASWIYDAGKIMVPDYILNKHTKLETVYNRIHEIRHRFEILRRDAHIEYLQKRLNNVADKETLQAEFVNKVKQLHDDFEFIGHCNTGISELSTEDLIRLDNIASKTFTRHFDRSIGLSSDELYNSDMKTASEVTEEHIIQDTNEQFNGNINTGELTNLKIQKGILNHSERNLLKEYISSTTDILSDTPFSKDYSKALEIINTYQNLLKKENHSFNKDKSKSTIIAKIILLSSIFAHLCSKEAYVKQKKLSEIMKIMQDLKNKNIIDHDIYTVFVKNNIYIDYARDHLHASQIDEINIEDIL